MRVSPLLLESLASLGYSDQLETFLLWSRAVVERVLWPHEGVGHRASSALDRRRTAGVVVAMVAFVANDLVAAPTRGPAASRLAGRYQVRHAMLELLDAILARAPLRQGRMARGARDDFPRMHTLARWHADPGQLGNMRTGIKHRATRGGGARGTSAQL